MSDLRHESYSCTNGTLQMSPESTAQVYQRSPPPPRPKLKVLKCRKDQRQLYLVWTSVYQPSWVAFVSKWNLEPSSSSEYFWRHPSWLKLSYISFLVSSSPRDETERHFGKLLQFHLTITPSTKCYFDLCSLAYDNDMMFMFAALTKGRAQKLEVRLWNH